MQVQVSSKVLAIDRVVIERVFLLVNDFENSFIERVKFFISEKGTLLKKIGHRNLMDNRIVRINASCNLLSKLGHCLYNIIFATYSACQST